VPRMSEHHHTDDVGVLEKQAKFRQLAKGAKPVKTK